MSRVTFSDFQLTTTPTTGDFLVGYNQAGTAETRIRVSTLASLVSSSGVQGVRGLSGVQGIPGLSAVGVQGLQGIPGLSAVGVQGLQGIPGLSAVGVQGLQGTAGSTANVLNTVTNYLSTNEVLIQSLDIGITDNSLYWMVGSNNLGFKVGTRAVANLSNVGSLSLGFSGGSVLMPPNYGVGYYNYLPEKSGTIAVTGDILPTVTNYLSNNTVTISSISLPLTGSAPSDPVTPVAWANITVNNIPFKLPLYQ
jgi:hypothetical protein